MDKLTPSQQCKEAGLKSLKVVVEATEQSPQTLIRWHKNKPELFAIIIAGVVAEKKKERKETSLLQARKTLNLSQIQMAKALGWTSHKQISNIENGSRPMQPQTELAIECLLRRHVEEY